MNKKIRFTRLVFMVLFCAAFLFVSCTTKPPIEVTFESISQYEDGIRVTISGYLDLWHSYETTITSDSSCVRLRDQADEHDISIWIRNHDYGEESQPNRMNSLGLFYDEEHLVVWLDDGNQVGFGDSVRITGTLRFTDDGIPYINHVTKIEGK